jgi:tetratricopeptide (TPR) repeat protein
MQAPYVNTALRRAVRGAVAAALALGAAAAAEAAADRVLDQLSTETGSVVIQFNCPMSYVSNYPLRSGDELRIELQPLPGCAPPTSLGETLPVARDNPAGLVDVRLEQSLGARRALTLHFARTVEFLIRPRPGLTGIEIVLSRRVGRTTVEAANPPAKPSREPTRSLPAPEELDKLLGEARTAMQDRDYDAAIRLYTKLLEYPEHTGRPQAQEFLGLARERKGQLAQAKVEYQEYLKRYPDGADVDAVKQRLAAIVTLEGASKPGSGSPDASRWQLSGAVSQEYRHDSNTLVSNGVTTDGVGQSALDTNVDLQLSHRGEVYDFRSRVYAGYLHDMTNVGGFGATPLRLPQAYVEVDDTQSHWVSRLGRQSQSTGGVYGSYDGGYFGWLVKPGLRLGVAAGSPIQTYAASWEHQRTFGNLSAEFLSVLPGLDLSTYLFQQNAGGVLDAREVGAEARYYKNGHSLVGQLNYDVSFRVLNSATVLASWALPGRWVFTGIGDHRRSPFAGTYNALIGQPTTSIDSLIQSLGIDAVRALALDRSMTSDTVTAGLQRPIGERLQWGADLSFSRTGGSPASGGVAAVPSSGSAVSLSTQLIGGGWLTDNDMNTVGLAYTTRAGTKVASTYLNARYPLGPSFRIGPRLQVSHTSGSDPNTGTSAGWSASPSLLADWRFRRGLVQFESGYERSAFDASLPPGVPVDPNVPPTTTLNQSTKRFWFSLGYNISF